MEDNKNIDKNKYLEEVINNAKITADVKMNDKIMANFLFRHTYFSLMGVIGIIISLIALSMAIYSIVMGGPAANVALLIFAALIFTVGQPLMIVSRSKKQSKNGGFALPIKYSFANEGIAISQNNDGYVVKWEDVVKVISTKLSYVIYLSKTRALVISKDAIDDHSMFRNMMLEKCGTKCKNL